MTEIKAYFGRDKILYFRQLKDEATDKGAKLALQIEHTLTQERTTETKTTKDGPVVTQGALTTTLELTAVSSNDAVNADLYDAFVNGNMLECWEVNRADAREEGKFGAKYMRGKLQSWALPAPGEDTVDVSTTLQVEVGPLDGVVTIDAEEEAAINAVFRDLAVVVAPGA